jgi:hypothetical protein
MEIKEPCNFCREWYRPIEAQPGVWRLLEFHGYTIDIRLGEFRRIKCGYDEVYKKATTTIEYEAFDSPRGQALLHLMHTEATKIAKE